MAQATKTGRIFVSKNLSFSDESCAVACRATAIQKNKHNQDSKTTRIDKIEPLDVGQFNRGRFPSVLQLFDSSRHSPQRLRPFTRITDTAWSPKY